MATEGPGRITVSRSVWSKQCVAATTMWEHGRSFVGGFVGLLLAGTVQSQVEPYDGSNSAIRSLGPEGSVLSGFEPTRPRILWHSVGVGSM